jgi:hypothetical protein
MTQGEQMGQPAGASRAVCILALSVCACGFDRSAAGVTSFGMGSALVNGDLRFTHSGLLDSYSSFSVIFPADRASAVVLCNFNSNALGNFLLGPGGIRSIMLAH